MFSVEMGLRKARMQLSRAVEETFQALDDEQVTYSPYFHLSHTVGELLILLHLEKTASLSSGTGCWGIKSITQF